MKLTVLGKYGPYPKEGDHASSCYLVQGGSTSLVLDMGPGSLSRLMQAADLRKINGIFISHLHYDHTSDLLPFRYLLEDMNLKMKIFVRREESPWYDILFGHPDFEVINVSPSSPVTAGDFKLTFYEMKHTVPCLGVKVQQDDKALFYTGDTLFNDNIYPALNGTDLLLADCSKPAGFTGPHMTVENAKEINGNTGVRIISTHLSPGYDPDDEYKNFPGIETAREMKTYEI